MVIELESDYKGIVFGFQLSFSEKRFSIAFLFWGLNLFF